MPRHAVVAAALTLTGVACSSAPVAVTGAPTPTGSAATSCQALLAALPDSLGKGLDRRKVSPPGASAAAWGDGPVLLTCGEARTVPGYQPTSQVIEANKVDWYIDQAGSRSRWSTPTRRPQVILVLPADLQPDQVIGRISAAILAHTKASVDPLPAPSS
jgi:hypothetical protein